MEKEETKDLDRLKEAMDDLCVGYVGLAVEATRLAACSVMEDLNGPIISQVFSTQWEDGDEIITVTVRTLKDWFTDLQKWLPEYFFSKLVKECYEQVLKHYIETAMGKKVKPFQNPARASQQIINDRSVGVRARSDRWSEKIAR